MLFCSSWHPWLIYHCFNIWKIISVFLLLPWINHNFSSMTHARSTRRIQSHVVAFQNSGPPKWVRGTRKVIKISGDLIVWRRVLMSKEKKSYSRSMRRSMSLGMEDILWIWEAEVRGPKTSPQNNQLHAVYLTVLLKRAKTGTKTFPLLNDMTCGK